MLKVEADTLEEAYKSAASSIKCSVTELSIEIIQNPSPGVFGFFKKKAIIIATHGGKLQEAIKSKEEREYREEYPSREEYSTQPRREEYPRQREEETHQPRRVATRDRDNHSHKVHSKESKKHYFENHEHEESKQHHHKPEHRSRVTKRTHELNDTIIPQSFVHDQEEDVYDDIDSGVAYTADYDDSYDDNKVDSIQDIAYTVEEELNQLFDLTCFNIEKILVSVYDDETIMINFKGDDAALLIGKEGYRYKALSYMLFNWVNSKYDVQLRLEIAEFLQNQEEAVDRYLANVYETIEQDGRAQTKILDGVLVQIALRKLREAYPEKYVVIRSTRDGLKYIIVNDYHNN
jgi:spoIIIJ-associated protein